MWKSSQEHASLLGLFPLLPVLTPALLPTPTAMALCSILVVFLLQSMTHSVADESLAATPLPSALDADDACPSGAGLEGNKCASAFVQFHAARQKLGNRANRKQSEGPVLLPGGGVPDDSPLVTGDRTQTTVAKGTRDHRGKHLFQAQVAGAASGRNNGKVNKTYDDPPNPAVGLWQQTVTFTTTSTSTFCQPVASFCCEGSNECEGSDECCSGLFCNKKSPQAAWGVCYHPR